MSFVFPTNASQVQAFAGALYGVQVGTATMAQVNADIAANGGLAKTLNSYYAATFGGVATSTVASTVAANLGLTGAALTSGSAYIAAQLNAAAADARGAVISSIVNLFGTLSADATFGAAATAWNAKVAVAAAYTGATNVAVGTVVAATGSVFTLTDKTDNLNGTAGNDTFRAVTSGELVSADIVNGGDGTDTLNATQTGAAAGVTVKPLLNGVEVINFTVNSGATDANSATLDLGDTTGVQQVVLKDALSVNHATNTMTVTFATLAPGVAVGINGGAKGSSGGVATSLTVGVKDAATNTADALTINLTDALANVVTAANIETISLVSANSTATTSSTVAVLTADKLKTLNLDGTGTQTISALTGTGSSLTAVNILGSGKNTITTATATQTALKTIDGSTATGSNSVVISGTAIANTKVTMGTGADTVTFDTSAEVNTAIGTEGRVDGGAGKNTLKITEAVLDSTDASNISKAVNFQVIDNAYGGATGTASMTVTANAFTGINEFVFSTANVGKTGASNAAATGGTDGSVGIAVTGAENNDAFVFGANVTGGAGVGAAGASHGAGAKGVTFAPLLDTGNNVLTLTLKGSSTTASTTVTLKGADGVTGSLDGKIALDVSSYETVNLASTGKNDSDTSWANANAVTGGALAAGGATGKAIVLNTNGKLVITGNKHLDLTTGVDGTNATVDASAFTGIVRVVTSSGNNVLIGGSGRDSLTGGTGVDTYTGGTGADTYVIAAGDAGITGAENITDYALGSDILDIAPTTVLGNLALSSSLTGAIGGAGAVAGDTLTASIASGIITLSGNAVNKIDTVAELKAIFELLDTNNTAEVAAIVMGGNTYVITDAASGGGADTVNDIIQLVGVTTAAAVSATAATNVIVIA